MVFPGGPRGRSHLGIFSYSFSSSLILDPPRSQPPTITSVHLPTKQYSSNTTGLLMVIMVIATADVRWVWLIQMQPLFVAVVILPLLLLMG